ncbi:MAG: carbohydrate ABC transporter permease, partial [Chloroflexota bacterium]
CSARRAVTMGLARRGRIPTYVWMMLPGLVLFMAFFMGPLFVAFRLSFYDWPGIGTRMDFVGLRNFSNLLTDYQVWRALLHNLYFFILVFVLQNTVGLGLALLLDCRLPGHAIHRTVLFIPAVLSLTVTSYMWELMLSPQLGIINHALKAVGLGGLQRVWLGDPSISLTVVILVQAWQWMGIPMVVYLAGLRSIPREFTEAAMLDGANGRQVLFRVTFPLLAGPFTALTIICFVMMFRVFDLIYILGGPQGEPDGSTTTIGLVMLNEAFGGRMSYAMAIGVFSYALLGLIAGLLFLALRRRELSF